MAEPAVLSEGKTTLIVEPARAAEVDEGWFDADVWRSQGAAPLNAGGRGAVLRLERGGESWVLRHYQRGGLVASLVYDHYLWLGLERTRGFREYRLLRLLHGEGFPVPRPVAARAVRSGPVYRADIVTELLADAAPLSSLLDEGGPSAPAWNALGRLVRSLHDRGVDHPDLTAHNLLLAGRERACVVDFDNARIRPQGRWRKAGIERLQRSLRKVALETGTEFDARGWELLLSGYG